jgi:hypothetical protein
MDSGISGDSVSPMKVSAYFEYATVIRPQGDQHEGTPAHYLVEVLLKNPATGKNREEVELKKLANDLLVSALGQDVQEIVEFNAISESEAQKLQNARQIGSHTEGTVFLVEEIAGETA